MADFVNFICGEKLLTNATLLESVWFSRLTTSFYRKFILLNLFSADSDGVREISTIKRRFKCSVEFGNISRDNSNLLVPAYSNLMWFNHSKAILFTTVSV